MLVIVGIELSAAGASPQAAPDMSMSHLGSLASANNEHDKSIAARTFVIATLTLIPLVSAF